MALLSTKSDIFSLGIVFHNYLADGEFPDFIDLPEHLAERKKEKKAIYCAEPLLSEEGKLVVSSKIKEEYLVNLICAMLQPEPEDRPTALDVVMPKSSPHKSGLDTVFSGIISCGSPCSLKIKSIK